MERGTVRFHLQGERIVLMRRGYKAERFYDLGDAPLGPTHTGADGVFEGD